MSKAVQMEKMRRICYLVNAFRSNAYFDPCLFISGMSGKFFYTRAIQITTLSFILEMFSSI